MLFWWGLAAIVLLGAWAIFVIETTRTGAEEDIDWEDGE